MTPLNVNGSNAPRGSARCAADTYKGSLRELGEILTQRPGMTLQAGDWRIQKEGGQLVAINRNGERRVGDDAVRSTLYEVYGRRGDSSGSVYRALSAIGRDLADPDSDGVWQNSTGPIVIDLDKTVAARGQEFHYVDSYEYYGTGSSADVATYSTHADYAASQGRTGEAVRYYEMALNNAVPGSPEQTEILAQLGALNTARQPEQVPVAEPETLIATVAEEPVVAEIPAAAETVVAETPLPVGTPENPVELNMGTYQVYGQLTTPQQPVEAEVVAAAPEETSYDYSQLLAGPNIVGLGAEEPAATPVLPTTPATPAVTETTISAGAVQTAPVVETPVIRQADLPRRRDADNLANMGAILSRYINSDFNRALDNLGVADVSLTVELAIHPDGTLDATINLESGELPDGVTPEALARGIESKFNGRNYFGQVRDSAGDQMVRLPINRTI
ncbi:MAG: hypothetical protein WC529_06550 [Candidatus Margulisiibacteriota bacterium]